MNIKYSFNMNLSYRRKKNWCKFLEKLKIRDAVVFTKIYELLNKFRNINSFINFIALAHNLTKQHQEQSQEKSDTKTSVSIKILSVH